MVMHKYRFTWIVLIWFQSIESIIEKRITENSKSKQKIRRVRPEGLYLLCGKTILQAPYFNPQNGDKQTAIIEL